MAHTKTEPNDCKITYYDTVSAKKVEWLWYPYIPYGKITIVQGDPGEGKSTMMIQIAALITNGKLMPDGSGEGIPGNVIYQAAEDGIEDTVKPRLEAAGADCRRIAFLEQSDEEPIRLDDERLAQAIESMQAKLLVIDPLQAYLGIDSDMKSNSIRAVFGRLGKVAERTGCAVVLIGHMNKSGRDGLTLMEHMVLKYLLQERDIENSIGYGYRMRKIIEHAKISLRQKAVEYYGWSYIRSMFA